MTGVRSFFERNHPPSLPLRTASRPPPKTPPKTPPRRTLNIHGTNQNKRGQQISKSRVDHTIVCRLQIQADSSFSRKFSTTSTRSTADMKQFTIFTLGAILAYAYAQPHAAHLKLHEKRALAKREYTTTTEVVDVTTTIDVTVTIYGPSPTSGGSDSQPTSNAAPTSSAGTPNYHANDQIKNVAPNGPGPGGNPSPSPQPQQQPPSSAPQQQPPSSAPQQQQQPTSPAPQQQQQPTSAAAPVAPATSAAPVTSSGGSCGQIGGTCQGDATIYTGGGGACGWTNDTNSQDFFALPHGKLPFLLPKQFPKLTPTLQP